MDKILSARVDEAVLNQISLLAQKLSLSKKKIIEGAVQMYAQKMKSEAGVDVFEQSHGVWKRAGSADHTARQARGAFNQSMERLRK